MRCLVCRSFQVDRDHIKTRGSGGTDDDWNLMPLCRLHHVERHAIGIGTFAFKYPLVKNFLIERGWEVYEDKGIKRVRR